METDSVSHSTAGMKIEGPTCHNSLPTQLLTREPLATPPLPEQKPEMEFASLNTFKLACCFRANPTLLKTTPITTLVTITLRLLLAVDSHEDLVRSKRQDS